MKSVLSLLLPALLTPASARASCHLMEIVEIFAGTDGAPDAHYVVLQMTAANQGFVTGNVITTGSGTFATFAANVANVASGAKILVATSEAATLFGIAADLTASGALDFPGGMVAHDCSFDSVTYGSGPIPALIRGCALKKSGTTWSLGDPSPENNAGASAPMSTCVAPDGGLPEPAPDPDMGTPDGKHHAHDGPDSQSEDDGGCGCRVGTPAPDGGKLSALLALTALAAFARRRRP
jgi:MYXO-CTERM domain-containing protein